MIRRLAFAASLCLCLAGTALAQQQESLEAMEARLETERQLIEEDRRALNQDCSHVAVSDRLLYDTCSKLHASVVERMARWKQDSAQLQQLQAKRCAELAEQLKRWETGALRAAQVIRKNDEMIAAAKADRHGEFKKDGEAILKFGKNLGLDLSMEKLSELSMNKTALEKAVGDWDIIQGHARRTLSAGEVAAYQKSAAAIGRRMATLQEVLKAYREVYGKGDPEGEERQRRTLRQEVDRFYNDFFLKAEGGEAVGALLADVAGGALGKASFEGSVLGIKLLTSTAGAGVDNLELRQLQKNQEIMGRELVKAQAKIRELRTQQQAHHCR